MADSINARSLTRDQKTEEVRLSTVKFLSVIHFKELLLPRGLDLMANTNQVSSAYLRGALFWGKKSSFVCNSY